MQFLAVEQISPRMAMLPSGSLACRDVVIARTGTQQYHITELPGLSTDGDTDEWLDVERDARDVFCESAMKSFEASPVTLGHPSMGVDASNWRGLSVGHAANIRRRDDHLVADLILSDRTAINRVLRDGWRGISCGYNADYEHATNGRLRQINIIGNHIAVLPPGQEPRCGDLCAIGDSATTRRTKMNSRTSMADTLKDIRAIGADIKKLARREKLSRDQANLEGEQTTHPGGSKPTVGGRRVLKLEGPATSYAIQSAGDGVWLIQIGDITNILDPGQTTVTADVLTRHRRATAERDAGAAFAAKFNERSRRLWGR